MPDLTHQQIAFADDLYSMLAAGRKRDDSVVILVVGEDNLVKKVIEERRAVVTALSVLSGLAPGAASII